MAGNRTCHCSQHQWSSVTALARNGEGCLMTRSTAACSAVGVPHVHSDHTPLEHLIHSPSVIISSCWCYQCGRISPSISAAILSPTVSLTAVRTDCHTRGCSPVPEPRDSHSWNMAQHACLTLWGLSARMVSRTDDSTSRNTPTSYHWPATLRTTCRLSLLSVGAEGRGSREGSEEPA